MTTVVTGASGKVGRELVPTLTARGHDVRPLGRRTEPRFDWRDERTWGEALHGVEALFLLVPGGDDGHRDVDAEVARACDVVDRALAAGAERVVMLSAMGIEHAPAEVPLRRLELHVQSTAPAWTLVRPNWFFQNLTDGPLAALAGANDGELRAPMGDAAVSFVDAADVAEVAAEALTGGHHGAAYEITGPEALTVAEVVDAIGPRGAVSRYVPIEETRFRDEAAALGWQPGYVDTLCDLFATIRSGWAAGVSQDAARVLGRGPRTAAAFAAAAPG